MISKKIKWLFSVGMIVFTFSAMSFNAENYVNCDDSVWIPFTLVNLCYWVINSVKLSIDILVSMFDDEKYESYYGKGKYNTYNEGNTYGRKQKHITYTSYPSYDNGIPSDHSRYLPTAKTNAKQLCDEIQIRNDIEIISTDTNDDK